MNAEIRLALSKIKNSQKTLAMPREQYHNAFSKHWWCSLMWIDMKALFRTTGFIQLTFKRAMLKPADASGTYKSMIVLSCSQRSNTNESFECQGQPILCGTRLAVLNCYYHLSQA